MPGVSKAHSGCFVSIATHRDPPPQLLPSSAGTGFGPAAPHHLGAEKRPEISGSTQLCREDLHINEIPRRGRGVPDGSDGKDSAFNVRDPGSIPGSGRSPRYCNDNPKISWTEETGSFLGVAQLDMTQRLTRSLSGGGGGKPPRVHCPCAVALCLV